LALKNALSAPATTVKAKTRKAAPASLAAPALASGLTDTLVSPLPRTRPECRICSIDARCTRKRIVSSRSSMLCRLNKNNRQVCSIDRRDVFSGK
jgi:hypothetical protein